MTTDPLDTTPDAREVQFRVWRRTGSARCLLLAIEMSEELRRVTAAGIRSRHPDYTQAEVRWALLRLTLGDDLFGRAYPDAPWMAP